MPEIDGRNHHAARCESFRELRVGGAVAAVPGAAVNIDNQRKRSLALRFEHQRHPRASVHAPVFDVTLSDFIRCRGIVSRESSAPRAFLLSDCPAASDERSPAVLFPHHSTGRPAPEAVVQTRGRLTSDPASQRSATMPWERFGTEGTAAWLLMHESADEAPVITVTQAAQERIKEVMEKKGPKRPSLRGSILQERRPRGFQYGMTFAAPDEQNAGRRTSMSAGLFDVIVEADVLDRSQRRDCRLQAMAASKSRIRTRPGITHGRKPCRICWILRSIPPLRDTAASSSSWTYRTTLSICCWGAVARAAAW